MSRPGAKGRRGKLKRGIGAAARSRRLILGLVDPDKLGTPFGLVESHRMQVEEGRAVFVVALESKERAEMSPEQVKVLADTLGRVMHPATAVLVTVPDGMKLRVFEVLGQPAPAGTGGTDGTEG